VKRANEAELSQRQIAVRDALAAGRKAMSVVVVGNGDLARRAAEMEPLQVLRLEGAMGMASAVARGLLRSGRNSVVVLEGDGNFLMGMPAAEWMRTTSGSSLHLVFINRSYGSSGFQPIPIDTISILERLEYRLFRIDDLVHVRAALDTWVLHGGHARIGLVETEMETSMGPRPATDLAAVVDELRLRGSGGQHL